MTDIDLTAAVEVAAQVHQLHRVLAFPIEDLEPSCNECGEAFGWAGIDPREESQRYREHPMREALLAALPHIERQVRAEALLAAADEALKEARWQMEQGHHPDRFLALERTLTAAAHIVRKGWDNE